MNKPLAISILRYLGSLILLFLVCGAIFMWWAIGEQLPERSELAVDQTGFLKSAPPHSHLKVSSYNIGHGQGIKEHAWDYRDKKTTLAQLSQVAKAMKDMDADVFLLQEVDLDSNRTFRIDQMQFIKDRLQHPYHACALVWKKNYLPFPYWPLTHQIGYVRAANCILSKYPLSNHERVIFEKPRSNPFWYNWGYIDRGLERVDVELGDKKLALINVHLEAWERPSREQQIKVVTDYMKEVDLSIILGGDFNTVPLDAIKKNGFADEPDMDYQGESTFLWLNEHAPGIKIPSIDPKNTDPFAHYTFPSNRPDRRLDHIFLLGRGLDFINFYVDEKAGTASDHLPVVAVIKYR